MLLQDDQAKRHEGVKQRSIRLWHFISHKASNRTSGGDRSKSYVIIYSNSDPYNAEFKDRHLTKFILNVESTQKLKGAFPVRPQL